MKDSGPGSQRLASRILLGVNLAAYAAFIFCSLPARREYRGIFEQMGMKSLPAPTELVLAPSDPVYGVLLAMVPAALLMLQVLPVEADVKVKANVAALVALFPLLGLFILALHMPVHAIQTELRK